MAGTNLHTGEIEIIPAVLAKTKELLLEYVNKVSPHVKTIHIDVMDNKFVPNLTVGLEELKQLPKNLKYEFHWMVKNPEEWIAKTEGSHMHIIHVETIEQNWEKIRKSVHEAKGALGLAINPETPLEKILPYAKDAEKILVMSVHPGFSGQKYIKEAEEKISFLRRSFPKLDIEVDGGINIETAVSAVKSGANKIAAASAIFNSENVQKAIENLRKASSGAHAN